MPLYYTDLRVFDTRKLYQRTTATNNLLNILISIFIDFFFHEIFNYIFFHLIVQYVHLKLHFDYKYETFLNVY